MPSAADDLVQVASLLCSRGVYKVDKSFRI